MNVLRETINEVLDSVHIGTGRKDEFVRVVDELEAAISKKILQHDIDFYSEHLTTC